MDDDVPPPPPYTKTILESTRFLAELNQFTTQITNFYSIIFDKVQFKRMKRRQNLLPARTWIEMFISMERNCSVRKEVLEVLQSFGLDENDLLNLQSLRRVRNELCHPTSNVDAAMEMSKDFKAHPCFSALTKTLNFLKQRESR